MERENTPDKRSSELPSCAAQFIAGVVRKMRYRKRIRQEVREELTVHFEDELRGCTGADEREQRARRLIEEFGDPGLLAALCRRAKKRCRPLWAKVAIRSVQAVGILVVYSLLCSLRLFIGSPSLKVDYLAWLTDRTRAGREETLNAKPYFDEAAKALVDTELLDKALRFSYVRPADMNNSQREVLAEIVGQNAEAFELLRQGVKRPSYWVQYETAVNEPLPSGMSEPPRAIGALSPVGADGPSRSMKDLITFADPAWAFNRALYTYASGYRRLAQAFHASILWRACQGDINGALDDGLVLMDFGMHLQGRGTQTEQLVGIAVEGMACGILRSLLDWYSVGKADLARVQSRLADLYARHSTVMDVTGDRAVWLAFVQRTFTDDGNGNGRVLKEGLPLAAGDWEDGVTSLLLFDYPNRREMTSLIDAFLRGYQLILDTEPSHPQYEERKARWTALAQRSFLLRIQAPAMERVAALAWRMKTGRQALLTTVAIMRYAQDKGSYPSTLAALTADGYMSELPVDPYSDGAFGYRRTPDGFLLYSWGENQTDDGGRQGTGYNGQPRLYMENGDWVFWPVEVAPQTPKAAAQSVMKEEKAAACRAAAPLNHTVRIERIGSYLNLDYELIGADGKKYSLWEINDRSRPAFAVYQGDAKIGGDTFEFG